MTAADMAVALEEVQAKLAGAYLVAEYFHGIDRRDLDRAMAAWHPRGLSLSPGRVLDGSSAIRADLEKMWAALSEVYHWVTNLSLTVPGDGTMHGECRVAALCVQRSGTTIHEVGTIVFDYTRTEGTWLISREAVTIQRRDPAA
ncbi:MAG: nuclear transport factor 2 family protein [Streptosporangiaceae bacterium]